MRPIIKCLSRFRECGGIASLEDGLPFVCPALCYALHCLFRHVMFDEFQLPYNMATHLQGCSTRINDFMVNVNEDDRWGSGFLEYKMNYFNSRPILKCHAELKARVNLKDLDDLAVMFKSYETMN